MSDHTHVISHEIADYKKQSRTNGAYTRAPKKPKTKRKPKAIPIKETIAEDKDIAQAISCYHEVLSKFSKKFSWYSLVIFIFR